MLQRGNLLPHFELNTLDGDVVAYSTIWQYKNVVLLLLPDSAFDETFRTYSSQLLGLRQEWSRSNTECIITKGDVAGMSAPAVLVADQWGEIV
jgi:hypothetical protein